MATHSSILAWEISWTEEPGGLQSMGLRRAGHNWASKLQLGAWKEISFWFSDIYSVFNNPLYKQPHAHTCTPSSHQLKILLYTIIVLILDSIYIFFKMIWFASRQHGWLWLTAITHLQLSVEERNTKGGRVRSWIMSSPKISCRSPNSCRLSSVAQSCPTLCEPMDCSPPGFSGHGILQARILEWVAISFSRGSFRPKDWTRISLIGIWRQGCEEVSWVKWGPKGGVLIH